MLLVSCSGLEQSEYKKVRERNAKHEKLYRKADEHHFTIPLMRSQIRKRYSWEESFVGNYPRLTKEYLRCKGSSQNSVKSYYNDKQELVEYEDCNGNHSLSVYNGKEFIFPVLLELLNFIQLKTNQRLVITSGHRCPKHNSYVDSSPENRTSKHMIGAEVDFYVQEMEYEPDKIIKIIQEFYSQKELSLREFKNYEGTTNVSTIPIFNKEVFVKLFKMDEGRNFDNQHLYPYISIQVRYDRMRKERVYYSWDQAYNNYFRWW